ncbi:MAG: GntR family transcriptional regulator [Phycisphaerae bacterium]|nr:GntR family transcriptional regulator [Phycisphaerae bacterium]
MKGCAKQTQRDECYASLRRALLHGLTVPGQRLTESLWAEKLGVTRGSLREAMSMLLHEGLLTRGKRGGFFAPAMTRHDYQNVLEVRFALESGALRLMALKRLPPNNLARLRETCDVMEQMLRENLELGFAEADRRFHALLVEAGQNERLENVYSRAPLPLMSSPESNRERRREKLRRTLDEHRRLCDLLEKGNIPEACELLERHLLIGQAVAKNETPTTERNLP